MIIPNIAVFIALAFASIIPSVFPDYGIVQVGSYLEVTGRCTYTNQAIVPVGIDDYHVVDQMPTGDRCHWHLYLDEQGFVTEVESRQVWIDPDVHSTCWSVPVDIMVR